MKGVSERDQVFLAEMGIAPLWRLRAAAPAAAEHAAAPAQAAAPGVQAAAAADDAVVAPAAPGLAPPPPPMRVAPPAQQRASSWAPPAGATDEAAAPDAAVAGAGEPDIAQMDWAALHEAIATCRRCSACGDGRKSVFGTGAREARWLVVAGASSVADEKAGQPLAGEPGKLLDNMLFAVDLSRERDVYTTNLVKCRPASANGGERAPTAEEAAACRPYLERELALTKASTVLTLGQIAANGLLGKPLQEPLAGARGQVHALRGAALVATLHPGELLRRGGDKALAWADLCRAKAAHARQG